MGGIAALGFLLMVVRRKAGESAPSAE
jgi:hypothetical protein